MGERTFNDTGQAMLDSLPPVLRGSTDYQAVIKAYSEEIERFEGVVEDFRAELFPGTADLLLPVWEYTFKLPMGGKGQTKAQRRQAVLARILKLLGNSEGREWVDNITAIIGTGWTYQEHDPADPSSPVDGWIRITLPFQTGTSAFRQAQDQIREVTPAHLELDYAVTGGFQFDESELDVTEFGA